MQEKISPISEKQRLPWIDGARGVAIFGIFTVNIGAFGSPYFLYGGEAVVWAKPADTAALAIIDMFFQASFYTLFSLLFGFGIQMMKERFEEKRLNVYLFLFRRLFLLCVFGMVHAFFLWHGDILLAYGVIGLLFLLFLQLRTRSLMTIGGLLLGGSVLLITLLYYAARNYLGFVNEPMIDQAIRNYQSSDVMDILSQNYTDWLYANGGGAFLFLILILLPLFLFGMSMAKSGWLHDPIKYQKNLRILWIISFIGFITLKIGPYFFGNPLWFSYIQDNIGGTFSAIFYIVSIAFIANSPLGMKMIQPFVYVGRMALTNYILQSLFCFLFFYGIGLGWYNSISPFPLWIIAAVIFIGQIFFSKWWLTMYRYGPLEWVWRTFTYMKKQPFKKER